MSTPNPTITETPEQAALRLSGGNAKTAALVLEKINAGMSAGNGHTLAEVLATIDALTDGTHAADKAGETHGEISFSPFGKASLASATSEVLPQVKVPSAVAEYLADEARYFAGKFTRAGGAMTNRIKSTLRVNDDIARGVLVHRPADLKLTGAKLREAGAKEFARQVRAYAASHNLSTAPSRDNNAVTFRLVKPAPAKPANGPVTVTQTAK